MTKCVDRPVHFKWLMQRGKTKLVITKRREVYLKSSIKRPEKNTNMRYCKTGDTRWWTYLEISRLDMHVFCNLRMRKCLRGLNHLDSLQEENKHGSGSTPYQIWSVHLSWSIEIGLEVDTEFGGRRSVRKRGRVSKMDLKSMIRHSNGFSSRPDRGQRCPR